MFHLEAIYIYTDILTSRTAKDFSEPGVWNTYIFEPKRQTCLFEFFSVCF